MGEIIEQIKNSKKNLINLTLLLVMVVALPLIFKLAKETQIFTPKAANNSIEVTQSSTVKVIQEGGQPVLETTTPDIQLRITSPLDSNPTTDASFNYGKLFKFSLVKEALAAGSGIDYSCQSDKGKIYHTTEILGVWDWTVAENCPVGTSCTGLSGGGAECKGAAGQTVEKSHQITPGSCIKSNNQSFTAKSPNQTDFNCSSIGAVCNSSGLTSWCEKLTVSADSNQPQEPAKQVNGPDIDARTLGWICRSDNRIVRRFYPLINGQSVDDSNISEITYDDNKEYNCNIDERRCEGGIKTKIKNWRGQDVEISDARCVASNASNTQQPVCLSLTVKDVVSGAIIKSEVKNNETIEIQEKKKLLFIPQLKNQDKVKTFIWNLRLSREGYQGFRTDDDHSFEFTFPLKDDSSQSSVWVAGINGISEQEGGVCSVTIKYVPNSAKPAESGRGASGEAASQTSGSVVTATAPVMSGTSGDICPEGYPQACNMPDGSLGEQLCSPGKKQTAVAGQGTCGYYPGKTSCTTCQSRGAGGSSSSVSSGQPASGGTSSSTGATGSSAAQTASPTLSGSKQVTTCKGSKSLDQLRTELQSAGYNGSWDESTAVAAYNNAACPSEAKDCKSNPPVGGGIGSQPDGYEWIASCSKACLKNSDCPVSTDPSIVGDPNIEKITAENPEGALKKTNWCYGFTGGNRCLMLMRKGSAGAPAAPVSKNPPSDSATGWIAPACKDGKRVGCSETGQAACSNYGNTDATYKQCKELCLPKEEIDAKCTTPTAPVTGAPKTAWVAPTCTDKKFSGCAAPGGQRCTDYGLATSTGWTQALYDQCKDACSATRSGGPDSFCGTPATTKTTTYETISGKVVDNCANPGVVINAKVKLINRSDKTTKEITVSNGTFSDNSFIPKDTQYQVQIITSSVLDNTYSGIAIGSSLSLDNCSQDCNFKVIRKNQNTCGAAVTGRDTPATSTQRVTKKYRIAEGDPTAFSQWQDYSTGMTVPFHFRTFESGRNTFIFVQFQDDQGNTINADPYPMKVRFMSSLSGTGAQGAPPAANTSACTVGKVCGTNCGTGGVGKCDECGGGWCSESKCKTCAAEVTGTPNTGSNSAISCGDSRYKSTSVCQGFETFDKCTDNKGQSGASLCKNGANAFRCESSGNSNCASASAGSYNYSCSACSNLTVAPSFSNPVCGATCGGCTTKNTCGNTTYDTCDTSACTAAGANASTTFRCYAKDSPNNCAGEYMCGSVCAPGQTGNGTTPGGSATKPTAPAPVEEAQEP